VRGHIDERRPGDPAEGIGVGSAARFGSIKDTSTSRSRYDAIVIGSGPNGLAAAIELARAGWSVLVTEANSTPGGGAQSEELTLPGFVHDLCSAVHPLAIGSPFFRTIPLSDYGLEWIHPEFPLAHPLDDGTAVVLRRSIGETAHALGADANAYRRLMTPFVGKWDALTGDLLGPLKVPRHPLLVGRFGLLGVLPARQLAALCFSGEPARALFAGLAAHSMLPLEKPLTSAIALMLQAAAHAVGWPFPRGGAGRIVDALLGYLRALDGELRLNQRVDSLDDLPAARAILCDVTPRELLRIAGRRLPAAYRRQLARYRYGLGVFKLDWALDGPIPWAAPHCRRAGVVHVGGTLREVSAAERLPWSKAHAERPFVLIAQPSLFDLTRAPAGAHVAWAYCHVPHGSCRDMTDAVETQIERFAPGFRTRILARHPMTTADLERHNPNLVGGDIGGGVLDLRQLFRRPTLRTYRTPVKGLYICSSSTPPGAGVHGMCGYHAARAALQDLSRP
jgi:phytoene dehydrogenase-like protein